MGFPRHCPQAEDFAPLCAPLLLEVGLGIEESVGRPVDRLEDSGGCHFDLRPLEVVLVVGLEEKLAAGDEDVVQGLEEVALDEASAMVAGFGPGIGEEQVEAAHRMERQKPLHRIAGLQAEDAEVFQLFLLGAAAHFANPTEEALDREDVSIRVVAGEGQREGAVSASEINLEGSTICE